MKHIINKNKKKVLQNYIVKVEDNNQNDKYYIYTYFNNNKYFLYLGKNFFNEKDYIKVVKFVIYLIHN